MRIGMRGHDFGTHPVEELTRLYAEYGVQTVQLAIPKAVSGVGSYYEVDDGLLARLKTALAAADVEVSVLGCYVEPAAGDEADRQKQVETFKRGIECAAALGAGCIGTETTRYVGDGAGRAAAYARLCRSLDVMLEKARDAGVIVAVEPVAVHTLNSPALAADLMARYPDAPLAFILDAVNLLRPEGVAGQQGLWRECLGVFGDKIVAMHIKDAAVQGGELAACPLGAGAMDFGPVIAPWVRRNKPNMPLLREETSLPTARRDFAWMRRTFVEPA